MAVWSVVRKSELEGLTRLDPEFYEPRFLINKNLFNKLPHVYQLKNIALISAGPAYSSEEFSPNNNIPIAKIGDVTNQKDPEEWDRLSDEEFRKFGRKRIDNESILMTMTGDPPDIGKCSYVKDEKYKLLAYNQRVCKIKVKKRDITSQYLYAYLSVEKVRMQIERVGLGIRQRNVGINDIKNLKVAVFASIIDEITTIIDSYIEAKHQSKYLYSQAEQILLEELGLKDLDLKDDLFYTTTFKEIKNNNRMDAEYYMPKYENLMRHIKKNSEIVLFDDVFKIDRGDYISPDYYVVNGKRAYIRIKELTNNGPITENEVIKIDDCFEGKKLKTLREGDFVFAAIGATLGKINRVPKEYSGSFFSNNVARFRLKNDFLDFNTYFLEVLLRSPVCQFEFNRRKAQTAQAKILDDEIKKIIIPLIRKDFRLKIAQYVEDSYEKYYEAKNLLEQAKRKVEEMIEKEAGVR